MDVLGCAARFIQLAASSSGLPEFRMEQIIRGWQSLAVLPKMAEYCVISQLTSMRHGTNAYLYDDPNAVVDPITGEINGNFYMGKLVEHQVQIDFFGDTAAVPIELTRRRAHVVETLANSTEASCIFKQMNPLISCLYADDVQSMGEMDDGHAIRHRHMLLLHLSETIQADLPMRYVDNVKVHLKVTDRNLKNRG